MEIRHLQYITEIVRYNSFTKAADALHITQPTISKMIKNLENELNIELFIRGGKQIKLTDAGKAIHNYAGPILQLFDNLQAEIDDLTYLKKGSIRIGLPPMAGSRFFPGVIKKFQDRYPGITLALVEDGARKVEESVAEGTLDVGVVLWPADPDIFDSFPLVEDRLKVILHPSHPFASREMIGLGELAEERFILFNTEFALHNRIIKECISTGFTPRIVYESSQWDFIGEMVAENLGIAMLPSRICAALHPDKVRSVPLVSPAIPWRLVMVWRREGYLSLATRQWISFTRENFNG
ncbi:LysR family transcriptional regulator [Paenibacillus spongiae]|uniref:LysR family transcriptional regulator n=1 Tax=Paenibacillus spongiae TaxID=2909671 RepID=A0ABY5S5D5_9BACL|nr:LysR family transcriptional regulator [Paenibacillus spongiae]UVI27765.1 LysR family transcriptional regulator [Paenibacillus spongiae]